MTTTTLAVSLPTAQELAPFDEITSIGGYVTRWAQEIPDVAAFTLRDYLWGRDGVESSVTWEEFDTWTRAIAAVLTQTGQPGDRVAILCPTSLEYPAGFVGALRAGFVAVPLFSPDMLGHGDRLATVLQDCTPQVVITTADRQEMVVDLYGQIGLPVPAIICPDDLAGPAGQSLADSFEDLDLDLDSIAYLQYSSGSTRTPAGVQLTHRGMVVNALQLDYMLGTKTPSSCTMVSWLPLFHDMGLVTGVLAGCMIGHKSLLLDPLAFVLKPVRWLQAIANRGEVVTAGPNFAYDLVTRRAKPEDLEGLDLSGVFAMLNGAEPVRASTIERFVETFAPWGMRSQAQTPSYGLAEAVVAVTTTPELEGITTLSIDPKALQAGRLERAEGPEATVLVASGKAARQAVAVVDPQTATLLPEGEIGEIWVNGLNVATGYWNQPQATADTFGGTLAEVADPAIPTTDWLRTGDLGTLVDGYLYVTGRMKDLIIVDGRNIYPHDVEDTVQDSDPAIGFGRIAAFAVDPGDGEVVVVVAEQYRQAKDAPARLEEIARKARAAVSQEHNVQLHDFVMVEPDTIARTSSGKIARNATKAAYLNGTLTPVRPQAPEEN